MIGKVIESHDWRILATMEQNFQLLAEASPMHFAKSVQKAISTTDSGLCAYLLESENLFGVQFYGAQLVYALTLIACRQVFFSQACFSAFLVLEKRPKHLANLISVFLPWAPKTEAPFTQRIAIIKQFFDEDNDLAWKFLYSLLPEQTTVSGAFVPPKYLTCKIGEGATQSNAYWEESDAYMELAIEQGGDHKERLLELIGFLDKVPKDVFYKLIAQAETTAKDYTDKDKYVFWNKLLNLLGRHRQFPDADWAMPEEALSAIEILADKLAPKDRRVRIRRLFQNETYDILPTKYDSYDEKNTTLSSVRLKELDDVVQKKLTLPTHGKGVK